MNNPQTPTPAPEPVTQSAEDRLSALRLSKTLDDQAQIREHMDRIRRETMMRMNATDFEDVFLSVFSGEPPRYKKNHNNEMVDAAVYMGHVGGPNRELMLVDDQGREVLIVPPLMPPDKVNLDVQRDAQHNFYEINSTVSQISHFNPRQAASMLVARGTERWETLRNDTAMLEHIRRWNAVYIYFGREVYRHPEIPDAELGVPDGYVATRQIPWPADSGQTESTTGAVTPTSDRIDTSEDFEIDD